MFFVDIEDAEGNRIGPGPIASGVRWRYTQRLSRAGEWSLEVPLGEPRLQYATLLRRVHCYTRVGSSARRWQGGGLIEDMSVSIRPNSPPALVLSGGDLLRELAAPTVKFTVDATPSGIPWVTQIINNIFSATPGWTYALEATGLVMTARFVYETALNALVTTTEKLGVSFYLDPYDEQPRNVTIIRSPDPATVIATNMADPNAIERNPNVCLITDIERRQTAREIRNRYTVFGAGDGEARFTLAAATRWPNGQSTTNRFWNVVDLNGVQHTFSLWNTISEITDIPSILEFGNWHESVAFKDIEPVYPTDIDTQEAANALLQAATSQMIERSYPQEEYSLSVTGLQKIVRPGQKIRVVARKVQDGRPLINIDKELMILETTTEIDANGARIVGLTVSTSRHFAKTDGQIVMESIRKAEAYQAHPQIKPNENTLTFSGEVDADKDITFPFWLSRGTTAINSVMLRFRLDPFRSTAKTIGGTASGSVTIPDHSHGIEGHDHNFFVLAGTGDGPLEVEINGAGIARLYQNNGGISPARLPTDEQEAGTTTEGGGGQSGIAVDISSALTLQYGIYEDTPADTYNLNELHFFANAVLVSETPVSISGGFYELDLTPYMAVPLTGRPLAYNNTVRIADNNVAATTKRVRITAQIEVRSTIQSIAVVG